MTKVRISLLAKIMVGPFGYNFISHISLVRPDRKSIVDSFEESVSSFGTSTARTGLCFNEIGSVQIGGLASGVNIIKALTFLDRRQAFYDGSLEKKKKEMLILFARE